MGIDTGLIVMASLHGAVLALGLILPVGQQNLYVFSQGASGCLRRGLAVACAAASCDGLMILSGVLGLSGPVLALPGVKPVLMATGVAFLVYLGCSSWRSGFAHVPATELPQAGGSCVRCVLFACSVSLLNPLAILDTVAVIGGSSLSYSGLARVGFTLSCVAVSYVWFLGLAATGRLVARMPHSACVVGKVSALSLWACALALAGTLIRGVLR